MKAGKRNPSPLRRPIPRPGDPEWFLVAHPAQWDIWNAERRRQAERASKPRLQKAILAAARHYRGSKQGARQFSAGTAWEAITKTPYQTHDGATVFIEGSKTKRLVQKMWVKSRDETRPRTGITFAQWRKAYWPAARDVH